MRRILPIKALRLRWAHQCQLVHELACGEDVGQGYSAAGNRGDLRLALRAEGDPRVPNAGRQRLCGIAYGHLQQTSQDRTVI